MHYAEFGICWPFKQYCSTTIYFIISLSYWKPWSSKTLWAICFYDTRSISCFGSFLLVRNIFFSHRPFTQPGMWANVSAKLWTSSMLKYVFIFLHTHATSLYVSSFKVKIADNHKLYILHHAGASCHCQSGRDVKRYTAAWSAQR